MSTAMSVFAGSALDLWRDGLAVVPLAPDRKPYISGFNKWSRRPGEKFVAELAERYPDANIGILPTLSDVFVADCDDRDQEEDVTQILGPTQLRCLTGRGVHCYYRKVGVRLPGNLRKFGLNVDLKYGTSIVIAPPSIHESGTRYRHEDCDWSALKHLVPPNVERLLKFMEARSAKKPPIALREMRDGSRKLWINDLLCSHAMSCDTFEELLDVARTANENLYNKGLPMLDHVVVIKRTEQVWEDAQAGKLEHWLGREAVARSRGSEIDELLRLSPKQGSAALAFLMRLRMAHSAACKRGETFNITPKAMAKADVMPGWPREKYERARDLLLLAGLVEKVTAFKMTADGRVGAQYKLTSLSESKVANGGGGRGQS